MNLGTDVFQCVVLGHVAGLACPRVETGLLAVKAAVEPKKVVMAAILMRGSQVLRNAQSLPRMLHAITPCLLKSKEPCEAPANQLSQRRLHICKTNPGNLPTLSMHPLSSPGSVMLQMYKPHCVS